MNGAFGEKLAQMEKDEAMFQIHSYHFLSASPISPFCPVSPSSIHEGEDE